MAPATSCFLPSPMTANATRSQPLDPVGTTQNSHDTITSKMWRMGTILSLPRIFSKVQNPYGGPHVQLLPVVVSTDGDQVLFMLQNPHGALSNDYFVCSWKGGVPLCLPHLPAVVFLPGSMGLLLYRNGDYLVAHLSVKHNQNTGFITEGTLHLCKYNASSSFSPWTYESVTLPLPKLTNWHSHRVIPFNGTDLMWVDLKQGILHMSLSDDKPPSFHFVDLPKELSLIQTKYWKDDRPEMFRSVGCCNGKVQLVNVNIPHGSTTNTVAAVNIWTLDLVNRNWSKDYDNVSLTCRELWASYRRKLQWPNSVPISPFLMEDNGTILCLTVVEQNNKAWLIQIQIDMQTITLKDITKYPHYYSHMKQPFLINSSSMHTMILWPLQIPGYP